MLATSFLSAYQAATGLLAAFSPLWLSWRAAQGHEDRRRRAERLGRPTLARPEGPLAWLHGATNRDALLLLPLVTRLAARDFNVILSTGPMQSADTLGARLPARARHQFVPVDLPRAVAHFLDHWKPQIALVAGPDIRPNLLIASRRRGVPLLLVEGRWPVPNWVRHIPGVPLALFAGIEGCLVRSAADAERFRALGLANVRVAGSLSYDVQPLPADAQAVAALAGRLGTRPIWVADAIRPDEEPLVIAAHCQLRALMPSLLTVIVPRQRARGPGLAQAAVEAGLAVELHSAGQTALATEVHIADMPGDTGLFYRVAEIVLLGSSFGTGAGRSPVEAARLGRAILHGPEVEGFQDIYAALGAARGAARVSDADTLTRSVAALLKDGTMMRMMGRNAAAVIEENMGAADRTIQTIEPQLAQAMVAWLR